MVKIIEGDLIGKGAKFGVVAARFNDFITSRLIDGAVDAFIRHGVKDSDIEIVRAPGAFEIFQAAKKLVKSKKISCGGLSWCCDKGINSPF